jgi:hypothetical protein
MKMFSLSDGINYYEMHMLQSEEYGDQIIRKFKREYKYPNDPKYFLESLVAEMGLDSSDLTASTIRRIENEINNYLRRY